MQVNQTDKLEEMEVSSTYKVKDKRHMSWSMGQVNRDEGTTTRDYPTAGRIMADAKLR